MPYSDASLRPWILDRLQKASAVGPVKTVIDVGAGGGSARDFFQPHFAGSHWTAVEIWRPYIPRFLLAERYDAVIAADIRALPLPEADLYIFGDVMEHMAAGDAVAVWDRARLAARWLVLSLPVTCYPQGESEGNPFEAHLHHWSESEVLDSFAGITGHRCGPVVGAFVAEGLR